MFWQVCKILISGNPSIGSIFGGQWKLDPGTLGISAAIKPCERIVFQVLIVLKFESGNRPRKIDTKQAIES
jgi:hypothetical protein